LFHLLAGERPYGGKDSLEILSRVVAGPPTRLARLAPHAPFDLVAIVEKAMARDPAERYPTAQELALELGRFPTRQLASATPYPPFDRPKRWVRRHRGAVGAAAVAAAAILAIGALSVERVVRERDRAESARAQAEAARLTATEAGRRASERADDVTLS